MKTQVWPPVVEPKAKAPAKGKKPAPAKPVKGGKGPALGKK